MFHLGVFWILDFWIIETQPVVMVLQLRNLTTGTMSKMSQLLSGMVGNQTQARIAK